MSSFNADSKRHLQGAVGDCSLTLTRNALTDLPPGTLATLVTFLEMRGPRRSGAAPPAGARLERLRGGEAGRYRALYRALGERWIWVSRLTLDPAALAAILDDDAVEAYAVNADGDDIGLMEIDAREGKSVELAFFGLIEGHTGKGIGRWLMDEAVARAFARGPDRFFVHTCDFDSPHALDFYRRCGFSPYKRAIEFLDDPRELGILSPEAAPHVPLVRPL